MSPDRHPVTGERLLKIRGWFTQTGESPDVPYFERKQFEERYLKLPPEAFKDDTTTEPWSISTEAGETEDPLSDL